MMPERRKTGFTLLEVVMALAVLALGLALLLGLFASASRRLTDSWNHWERSHELITAAEYLLLAGPEVELDDELRNPRFEVESRYEEVELPGVDGVGVDGMELTTLRLLLFDGNRRELDDLSVDCWRSTLSHAQ